MLPIQTERERLNRVLFYGAIFLLGYLAFQIIRPFIIPLAWAGIFALCVFPLFRKLEPRRGAVLSAVLSTLAVALLIILPTVLLAAALLNEGTQAVLALQRALEDVQNHERVMRAWAWAHEHLPLPAVDELKPRLMGVAASLTTLLAAQAGAILQNLSVFFFKSFVALFALFFFLRDSKQVGIAIRQLLPFDKDRQEELIAQTRELVFAATAITLIIAAAQGFAGGVIFAILGVKAPLFWGVIMGFCALIPVVGTTIVWIPTAIWLILSGDWVRGVILLVLGAAIIGMIDNILRPLLMSGRSTMNGLVIFISLLGGVFAFGFIGLVLGPVVAATVQSMLRVGSVSESPAK